jgi:hypothetical protein
MKNCLSIDVLGLGVLGLALAACGGASTSSSPGSSVVNGTAGGAHVGATSSVGLLGTMTEPAGITTTEWAYAGVMITNLTNGCSFVENESNPPNASALSLIVTAPGSAIGTGKYSVGASSTISFEGEFATSTATCGEGINEEVASGAITFTEISSASVKGTFDVTMNSGDRLTGNFDAPICNVSLRSIGVGPAKACGS